jgi:hypothetical protein
MLQRILDRITLAFFAQLLQVAVFVLKRNP